MKEPFHSWHQRFEAARDEDRQVADAMARTNLLRLRWIVSAVMPLFAGYVGLFWFVQVGDSAVLLQWKRDMRGVHVALLAWWILLGVTTVWALRYPASTALSRMLLVVAPLGSVVFSAIVAALDQPITPNITPFLMGSMFTSLLFLMRTRRAVLVHSIGCAVFLVGMLHGQADPAIRLSNCAAGVGASLISVLLSAVLWRKDARFLTLQRQLSARNDQLQQQREDLERSAAHDPLTGLCNRVQLFKLAEAELQRARRRGTATSAIMLDIDHFKRVNDVHGHQGGDAVLIQMSNRLAASIRSTDLLGRMGGEEFMAVLPDTGLAAAVQLAEKLRECVLSPFSLPGGHEHLVTASCGVSAVLADSKKNMDWLYASADHALYEAKSAGRNCVRDAGALQQLTTSDFQRLPKT